MSYEIRNTDVFAGLAAMPEKSVHCCVTSPPYWALRQYLFEGACVFKGDVSPEDRARIIAELESIGVRPKL